MFRDIAFRKRDHHAVVVVDVHHHGVQRRPLVQSSASGYLTSMRRRFDVSPAGFGVVTSSTPSLNDAFTSSSLTPSGSGMLRENEP